MPATLKSFDLDDEMSLSANEPHSTSRRQFRSGDIENRKDILQDDDDEFDDIEFDDTRMETPRNLRKDGTIHSFDTRTNQATDNSPTRYRQEVRTLKVSLKDDGIGSRRPATPRASQPNSVVDYRSRNGTPLRNVKNAASDEFSFTKGKPDEDTEIIRKTRLITDKNEYDPQEVPPIENGWDSSPKVKKGGAYINNSPPSNMKIRPYNFNTFSSGKNHNDAITADSIELNNGDIEFDPSEEENDKKIDNLKETYDPKILANGEGKEEEVDDQHRDIVERIRSDIYEGDLTKEEIAEQIEASINHLRQKDTSDHEQSRPKLVQQENDEDDESDIQEKNSSTDEDDEPEILEELSSCIQKSESNRSDQGRNDFTRASRLRSDGYRSGLPRSDSYRSGIPRSDIYRSNLLRSDGFRNEGYRNYRSEDRASQYSKISQLRSDPIDINILRDTKRRQPISKVSSPVKVVEDDNAEGTKKPRFNQLSGQYARQVLRQRRERIDPVSIRSYNGSPVRAIGSLRSQSSAMDPPRPEHKPEVVNRIAVPKETPEEDILRKKYNQAKSNITKASKKKFEDWPTYKWRKLEKLLALEELSPEMIINSDMVMEGLDCSKHELLLRVKYLMQKNKTTKPKQDYIATRSKPGKVVKRTKTSRNKI